MCPSSGQVGGKKSRDILAKQVGQSKNQIQRYIRLTELIPELMDMVDEKKIAMNPAYELLSFLQKGGTGRPAGRDGQRSRPTPFPSPAAQIQSGGASDPRYDACHHG